MRALRGAALFAVLFAGPTTAQPVSLEPRGGSSSVTAADSARDAELDALTAEIASRFRCLVCRGQSVQESSSGFARDVQAMIRQKLEEGQTPEEIEAFFLASYGDYILLKPPAEGLNLVVYITPLALFLGAFVLVGLRMARNRRLAPAGAGGAETGAGGRGGSPSGPESARPPREDDLDADDRAWLDAAVREKA